jgi:dUTP pyrophosphatase
MTDLYLCVPHDDAYYMYCDLAYKYNERAPGERDSGFDVYCADDVPMALGDTAFLKFGIESSCAMKGTSDATLDPRAFWLMPRSSISKTNFICANSKGLIDSGYRGPLMGAVRKLFGEAETIKKGVRLFQIVSGSAKPWRKIVVVRTVAEFPKPTSERGSGGFGSTGTN